MPVSASKRAYAARLCGLIQDHSSCFVVGVDNVGSKQLQQIRVSLRGQAEVIMGKNTTIRKVIRDFLAENPDHPFAAVLDHVQGNVGFVFTNGDLSTINDMLLSNRVPAPARVGAIAPVDVFVEPGPTGCDPGQTSWFQALNIPTKINRGQIEMISRVHLVEANTKVGNSEAALLTKLNLKPFTYGLVTEAVYDNGMVFDPAVLAISEDDIMAKIRTGASYVAALGMEIGYPTKASLPHTINNALKMCVSLALDTDFSFPKADDFKSYLANPGAFAPAAAAGGGAAAAEVAKEEESEEESAGGAGGLFDDDEDDW
jgi:large subunit ribosomal protein LP0